MIAYRSLLPPRWLFAAIEVGAFAACGIYLGIMHVEGVTTAAAVRAGAFGLLGLLMLWGVLGKR